MRIYENVLDLFPTVEFYTIPLSIPRRSRVDPRDVCCVFLGVTTQRGGPLLTKKRT